MAVLNRLLPDLRLALAAMLALAPLNVARADPPSLEYQVKATYLYKFAPFVEWPRTAFPAPDSPVTLCIVGEDPFGPTLDAVTKGQSMGGHPFAVRRMKAAARGMGCQILFVGRSSQAPTETLKAVAGEPVLTVTDRGLGVAGGMIEFVLQDGRVRFNVDAAAAQAAGVPISSKLLQLALSVKRSPG